jgi:anti-sigma factor RsiW
MNTLCGDIDNLAMVFVDDELAEEERRELELHLLQCAECRARVEQEHSGRQRLRQALAAPAMPEALHARILGALDQEDSARFRRQRWQWMDGWALPGGAMLAAAAAIIVFFTAAPPDGEKRPALATVREPAAPLQVVSSSASARAATTASAVPDVEVPRIAGPGARVMETRLGTFASRPAAQVRYEIDGEGGIRHELQAVVMRDAPRAELQRGTPVAIGERQVFVSKENGITKLSYVDERNIGYVFTSRGLGADAMVQMVIRSRILPTP